MIKKEDIDNSFKYYNLDDKYKDRCYKCINNINSNKSFLESFNRMNNLLNNSNFKVIRKLWKYKDVNELFCEGIDPFVTNIIIL